MPRIVLDSPAKAHFFDHLEVVHRPLVQPLRLDDLALIYKLFFPPSQLRFNGADRLLDCRFRHHIVRFGVDRHAVSVFFKHFTEQRINRRHRYDLVAPKLDPVSLFLITREEFDHVTAHSENAAVEIDIHAFILQFDQPLQKVITADLHSRLDKHQHPEIRIRIAEPEYARNRRYNDYIMPLEQPACRREPQPVDLVVDRRFFFDIKVGRGNICLGLVIVIVRDKIFDRIFREKCLKFLV